MKSKQVYFFAFGILLTAMMLVGCGEQKDDVLVVQDRAAARWNALIAGDAEKAYSYLSPGYRSTVSLDDYLKRLQQTPLKWVGLKPVSIECDQEVCTAKFFAAFTMNMPGVAGQVKSEAPSTEKWVKLDGAWYYLPDLSKASAAPGADAKTEAAAPLAEPNPTSPVSSNETNASASQKQ